MNATLSSNETFSVEYCECSTAYKFASTWGQIPVKTPPQLYATMVFSIVIQSLTCPFTVFFNLLVIVTVKSKRQLQTSSNILLACLAATDLAVGVLEQPLYITTKILILVGYNSCQLCIIHEVMWNGLEMLCATSLYILVLIGGERFLSVKYSFSYKALVTKKRIIVAAAITWALANVPSILRVVENQESIVMTVYKILRSVSIAALIYFHITVYREVCRHEKQIVMEQVSVEVKRKMLKDRKGFKTTSRILIAVSLCYLPSMMLSVFGRSVIGNGALNASWLCVLLLFTSLTILNSFINPLIYTVGNRNLRLAMIQCLFRTDIVRAGEIEKRLFGSPNIVTNVQQQENIVRRDI